MFTSWTKLGKSADPEEVTSTYLAEEERHERPGRFVVSLVLPYGGAIKDGVQTAEQAGAAALALVFDPDKADAMWMIYDRQTGEYTLAEQHELAEVAMKEKMI